MHRLLEFLPLAAPGNQPVAWWTPAHITAVGQSFNLTPTEAQSAALTAQSIRQGQAAWAWDNTRVTWFANEVPLTIQGQPRRLDRLVQLRGAQPGDAPQWWVLDYKSAVFPERDAELVAQLGEYREAVAGLYAGEVVRAAFLTGEGRCVEMVG